MFSFDGILVPLFLDATSGHRLRRTTLGYFTFWICPFAQRNHYVYSQASRSNHRGYLHVLKYLLFISSLLKQKGVTQTNRLADV